jgi:hypothetical protein
MIRRALVVLGCGVALLTACAGSHDTSVGQTGTTAGSIGSSTGACIALHESCSINSDCCSQWCVSGSCSTRQP